MAMGSPLPNRLQKFHIWLNCGLDGQSVCCPALEALQSLWMWPELAPSGAGGLIGYLL